MKHPVPSAVVLYWVVALVFAPLGLLWLHSATGGDYSPSALLGAPAPLAAAALPLGWALLGAWEMFVSTSNLRRLYPVLANIRYLLEFFRPEIQQYFIMNSQEEKPFSRERRDLVYRRAKGADDTLPFGTEMDITAAGFHSLSHSIRTTKIDRRHARVDIGGPDCERPYSASRLNISAMSFGSLSGSAIRALNRGAALGGFAHNTGEGGLSPHHLKHGGDLVWQIGTGYFGCRDRAGRFDDGAFAERARLDNVKMVELKLSQGAKPGHGGVLPGAKVTREIADIRLVEAGRTVVSPPSHPEFDTPVGLLEFVRRLRRLCGGKPVGFKLCLGRKTEFLAIVKAMLETRILPDFISIDGSEGGTGAAPVEFTNRFGMPCLEATYYADQVLTGAGLRRQVRILSAGITATGFDMLEKIAVGADAVNAARAMMLALGCIQSRHCNTDMCPTGIATQNPRRARAVDVGDRSQRVRRFHHATVEAFLELCGAMGLADPDELSASSLLRRGEEGAMPFDLRRRPLEPGQLLSGTAPEPYREDWDRAAPGSF